MGFDYSASGLPENPKWKKAAEICEAWLNRNMSMFGPERITNFMHNQPVAAAKRLIENCDDCSEESVTLALLGPAKGIVAQNPEWGDFFGPRAVALLTTMAEGAVAPDANMTRDANRLFMVEAVSSMTDQMIGRKKIDAHHETRWRMLNQFEREFAAIKGQDPKLDAIFEEAAKKSHVALEALDREVRAKKPHRPRPPGMHG